MFYCICSALGLIWVLLLSIDHFYSDMNSKSGWVYGNHSEFSNIIKVNSAKCSFQRQNTWGRWGTVFRLDFLL
jgi:hypothetical protein